MPGHEQTDQLMSLYAIDPDGTGEIQLTDGNSYGPAWSPDGGRLAFTLVAMEDMNLGRRYRSIYLAGATFNLLVDDTTAAAALGRIAAHLEPDGVALVPLTIPMPTSPAELGTNREHVTKDGVTMRVAAVAEERDEASQVQVAVLRYELTDVEGVVESTERRWVLHWHTQPGFRALAEAAGLGVLAVLDPDGGPAGPEETTFVVLLTPASQARSAWRTPPRALPRGSPQTPTSRCPHPGQVRPPS